MDVGCRWGRDQRLLVDVGDLIPWLESYDVDPAAVDQLRCAQLERAAEPYGMIPGSSHADIREGTGDRPAGCS